MKRFGPLKNMWEGGVRGEGYLKTMKPIHGTMGIRLNWPQQVMKKAHQKKGLHSIGTSLEDCESDEEYYDDDAEQPLNVRNSHWKYKNVDEVYDDYRSQKPMCLVSDGDGTFGAILRTGQVVKFALNMQTKAVLIRGMHFLRWGPVVEQSSKNPRGFALLREFNVQYTFILLPLQLNKDVVIYSGIREDYAFMDATGDFRA
jgi:hypothetical protein